MNYLFMNEVIIFTSILFTYQNNLFDKMSDSDFVFDYINWVFFSYHKITLKHGGSYIKSPKSLQNKKKTAIDPQNKGDECFKYDAIFDLQRYCKQSV